MSVVISASRMTDMPKYYPDQLIAGIEQRLKKGVSIHSIVLWTKHPRALCIPPLGDYLLGLREQGVQLFSHITITGLGGKAIGRKKDGAQWYIEPNVPQANEAIGNLKQVIALMGSSKRICLRIDPLVIVSDAWGCSYSNIPLIPDLLQSAATLKIENVRISLLERGLYQKVDRRFARLGCRIHNLSAKGRLNLGCWLRTLGHKWGIEISACCVPGLSESSCIDGNLLTALHEEGRQADLGQPRKRELCGCTNSIDIGGWPPKVCYSGCDYCYSRAFYH